MSWEVPETVEEFEQLLLTIQMEAEEALANCEFEDYRDARSAYSGVLAQFNRKCPPQRRSSGNHTNTG